MSDNSANTSKPPKHLMQKNEEDQLIDSNDQLRKRLSGRAEKITKKYNKKESERKKTKTVRKSVIKNDPPGCATCETRNIRLEAHHIEPIEVGGQTKEKNIIMLCKKKCHKKVHKGRVSIVRLNELKNLKGKKREEFKQTIFCNDDQLGEKDVPELAKPIYNDIRLWQQKRQFAKAVGYIECSLPKIDDSKKKGINAKIYLIIKEADIMRRRAGNEMRSIALAILNDEVFPKINDLDPANKLRFYNERAYIHRLLGRHEKAIDDCEEVIKLCKDNHRDIHEYVVASLCKLMCDIAPKNKGWVKENKQELIKKLAELQKKVNKLDDEYWKGRCTLNIVSNKLKIYIKAGDGRLSRETLEELRKLYYKSDITTGWTESIMDTVSQLSGLVHVYFAGTNGKSQEEDRSEGRKLLVRAFNARINNNEHFGDIRDIGFGLARAIKKSKPKTAEEIRDTMNKTIDGASFMKASNQGDK